MASQLLKLSSIVKWDEVQVEDKALGYQVDAVLDRYGRNDNDKDWGRDWLLFFWSIVDLQRCASLCCTAKWLSYTHRDILFIYIYTLFHYGLSQEIGYSSLCYTVGRCCLSILNVIVCIYQPQTPETGCFWQHWKPCKKKTIVWSS